MMAGEWSEHEDEALRRALKSVGPKRDWNSVADLVGRTAPECEHRWKTSVNPKVAKGPWTPEASDVRGRHAITVLISPPQRVDRT